MTYYTYQQQEGDMPVHKHAEVIKAWADGAQIQVKGAKGGWVDIPWTPDFMNDLEYRVKPEVVYPKSAMTNDEIEKVWDEYPGGAFGAMRAIADTAVRHAIDAGQVLINKDFKHD